MEKNKWHCVYIAASPPPVALRAGAAPLRRRPGRAECPGGAHPEGRVPGHRSFPTAAAPFISFAFGEHRRRVDLWLQGVLVPRFPEVPFSGRLLLRPS
jgi:hypothetical protein